MRNPRFIALHRGGLLEMEQHRQLMSWALAMTEHLIPYLSIPVDSLLLEALEIGKQWGEGSVGTGEAMRMSRSVHKHAQSVADPAYKLFCRVVGQAVATAHMADHSMGPVYYGRKLVTLLGMDADKELAWQLATLHELCPSLADGVVEALSEKGII